MSGLPVVRLADAAKIINGGTPKTGVAAFWDGGVPWVTPAEMGKRKSPYMSETRRTLSAAGIENSSAKVIPANSVVLSTRAPIGHLIINTVPMAFNQGCRGLVPRNGFDTKYLYYFLEANRQTLDALGVGTTFKELSATVLGDVRIPALPLPEQQRIVAILDEAFEGIATVTANAEKNLLSAEALPSSRLAYVARTSPGAQTARLGDLVTRLTNGFVGPIANVYVEAGIPYLLARHVKNDNLSFDNRTFVTNAFNLKNAKSMLKAGDVLLVKSGHIGHTAVVPPEHAGHNCHAMIVMTPRPELSGHYLSAYFNSQEGRAATQRIRSGSTVPHLTCKEVRELQIPLPSIDVQMKMVKEHQALKFEAGRLADAQRAKLTALAALKQSLLHQAFTGQLTGRAALAA